MNADLKIAALRRSRPHRVGRACGLLLALAVAPAFGADEKKDESKPKAVRAVPRLLMPPASPGLTRITWRNGEELRGEFAAAGDGFLSWKTPLFSELVKVKQEVIRRVDFTAGFQRAEGNFRLALADGSHLTGELEKLDDKTITFNSAACGVVTVKREQAVAIERIAGEGIVTAGPLGLLPDKTASRTENGAVVTPLFLAAAGRVASPGFNLVTQRTLDIPAKSIADLLIRTEGVPDFKFTVATGKEYVAVETWGDELVLLLGERFVSAGNKFKDEDRMAHLRLAWDQAGERAALYGSDGTLWAELGPEKKVEPPPKKVEPKPSGSWMRRLFGGEEPPREEQQANASPRPAKGVALHNKGSGILVERFSISEWNGHAPPAALVDVASVETNDTFISGEPVSVADGNLNVHTSGGDARAVPLASVRAIRWPRAIKSDRDAAQTDLWFSDGNLLRGKLTAVQDAKAVVATAFSDAPVSAALARGRAVVLPEPDKKEEPVSLTKLDTLRAGETTLHGTIEPQGGELPHFLPVGAEVALPPVAAKDLTMTRSLDSEEKFQRAPALLHVKTKETLPVTLLSVSREKVEFTWDAAESKSLEIAQLHAVQFSIPAADGKGFDGAGWRAINQDGKGISRKGDAVILQPGAGIGHPYMLQGGDINFRMGQDDGRGLATIRIRLFCQGTERDSNSLNLLIGDFGGDIYCGEERGEGQLTNSTEVASNGEAANVRLSFPGDKVELWVNKVKVVSTTRKTVAPNGNKGAAQGNPKRTGTGIVIETAPLWGNQQGSVKLMDLSMDTSPCMAGPPAFADDARREALLLPRLRREDPPRQVLIGRNGDLLRGEIEGMTTTHLAFRTGLETFKVPIERIAAAVWVIIPPKPVPAKEEPAPGEKPKKKENPDEILSPAGDDFHFVGFKAPLPGADKKEKKPDTKKDAAKEEKPPEESKPGLQWLDLTNGGRLALKVEAWNKDFITGQHPLLGKCRIPRALVHHFTLKEPPPPAALTALSGWKLEPTADPVIPDGDEKASPLAGKDAADFKLPMLEGDDFSLSKAKGKVVVLDFWATWCGPCVKSLPGLIEAMSKFPPDEVSFIAVNQGETKDQVKKFLTARQWQMPVGFDADQKVAKKYGVEGIPHTVVIDREGKIAFTQTGLTPNGDQKIADAVKKALEAPAPGKDKPKEKEAPKEDPNDPLLPEPKGS